MGWNILSVAYPFTPVGPDAVGGSEQILTILDRELTARGHNSYVVAVKGSRVAGRLIATPKWKGALDEAARSWGQRAHRIAIEEALNRLPIDLVHMHSLDFHTYLPSGETPALATLHLPPSWYPQGMFALRRPNTYLHCVSASQRRNCPPSSALLATIANGVEVERFRCGGGKRDYALALGRICPEKGFHVALDAARIARSRLALAGEVFTYADLERYFREEIAPRLNARRRFIGPAGFERKRELLSRARCLLIPSLVAETSSLVAMEALASGTPVIAYPSGALAEIVEHGRTGFLVASEKDMAEAIRAAREIDPETCRRAARERFSARRMVAQYFEAYAAILGRSAATARATAQARVLPAVKAG
jgi:glycosyltransferase involved in cell wall biosynthesis